MHYSSENQVGVHRCSIGHAFKLFWVHYFDFTGHSTRSEYWWMLLWNIIISLPISTLVFYSPNASLCGSIAKTIYFIVFIIPSMALNTRRFNDTGLNIKFSISLTIITIIFGIFSNVARIFYIYSIIYKILITISFILALLPSNYLTHKK